MIIRRIQVIEPAKERTKCEKNKKRVEDSAYCDADAQSTHIKVVRHEDHHCQDNASKQLRRIYPRSAKAPGARVTS